MTEETLPTITPRIIALEGGQNFREVGGYPTIDGGRMRHGRIWRSARLDELTEDDIAQIAALEIATVADLRRTAERRRYPTHAALLGRMRAMTWDVRVTLEPAGHADLFEESGTPDQYFDAILRFYAAIAGDHTVQLADFYAAVAHDPLPMLVHCAAGKDRTGLAVAILLELLGVERPYILADYAFTEQLLDWERLTLSATAGIGARTSWVDRLPKIARDMMLRSDPRYLSAAFAHLERQHGTVSGFARDRLGVTDTVVAQLRERLVEHTA